MPEPDPPPDRSTCWTMIRAAGHGEDAARADFARRYTSVIRAYLGARWRSTPLLEEIDDAAQEVFLECLRENGALARAREGSAGGFRAYLCGVVRNIALRFEQRRAQRMRRHPAAGRAGSNGPEPMADDPSWSKVFDRAWAQRIVREAADCQRERAAARGPDAERRVELLRLRHHEGLPIRTIATQWEVDPARLHHEYARAREEFRAALLEVLAFTHPDAPGDAQREARFLLELLA